MKDYITLGATPCDEPCEQLGDGYDRSKALLECRVYRDQLLRIAKEAGKEVPAGLTLAPKGERHDFGTYYEVAATFDSNDHEAIEMAYWFDHNVPANWDDEARKALRDGMAQLDSAAA